jgi:hypothetical protein
MKRGDLGQMSEDQKKSNLIIAPNLFSFFFEGLNELNNKSTCPVPQEVIFYSSVVLDKYSLTDSFFEVNEGRVREKILGIKLLEAHQFNKEEKRKVFQEIGDTALFLCGYFSESVNRKILDINYYASIGKSAYHSLNHVVPEHLNIPSFYHLVASSFEPLAILISKLASRDRFSDQNHLLKLQVLNGEIPERIGLLNGIHPANKKVS